MDPFTVLLPPQEAAQLRELELEPVRVDPEVLYTALEVATILRLEGSEKSRRNGVYRIPEALLRRTPVGPSGGLLRWQGRDLIAYLERRRGTL